MTTQARRESDKAKVEEEEARANEAVIHQLLWNVTSYELLAPLTPKVHPEFFRLALPGEEISAVSKLLPEQVILRWLNHHIRTHTASPPSPPLCPGYIRCPGCVAGEGRGNRGVGKAHKHSQGEGEG